MHTDIVRALYESSGAYFRQKSQRGNVRPGLHEGAQEAFKSWVLDKGPCLKIKKNVPLHCVNMLLY